MLLPFSIKDRLHIDMVFLFISGIHWCINNHLKSNFQWNLSKGCSSKKYGGGQVRKGQKLYGAGGGVDLNSNRL